MRTLAEAVEAQIKPVCPIFGVSIGREDDRQTWRVSFKDEATPQQRASAQAQIDTFDLAAYAASEAAESARRVAIHDDQLRVDLLGRLKSATAAQISNYVDTNVTDIASARALFKRILLLIALDARNGT